MFGYNKNKKRKKVFIDNEGYLVVCDKCYAKRTIMPPDIVLGNFRYWFVCEKCGAYTRLSVSKFPKKFKQYFCIKTVRK